MGSVKEKVERVVAEEFPGATLQLEYYPPSEKWGGDITWEGFSRKTHLQRQRLLNATLKRRLTEAERRNLTAILAFTPAEMRAHIKYSAFP